MAITAKCDIVAAPAATNIDVQPAAGEVWLIKTLTLPAWWSTGAIYGSVSLWDGTEMSHIIAWGENSGASFFPGMAVLGKTVATPPNGFTSFVEYSIVLTNSVRLRFRYDGAAPTTPNSSTPGFGYSGVQLA